MEVRVVSVSSVPVSVFFKESCFDALLCCYQVHPCCKLHWMEYRCNFSMVTHPLHLKFGYSYLALKTLHLLFPQWLGMLSLGQVKQLPPPSQDLYDGATACQSHAC